MPRCIGTRVQHRLQGTEHPLLVEGTTVARVDRLQNRQVEQELLVGQGFGAGAIADLDPHQVHPAEREQQPRGIDRISAHALRVDRGDAQVKPLDTTSGEPGVPRWECGRAVPERRRDDGPGCGPILPAAGDPRLWERYAASATDYVALAEAVSGPIPQPVDFSWPWGDAMQVLDELAPDLRIVNLETSITGSDDFQAKAVLYRMHPGNVSCLSAARLDACTLANNHVLDFGAGGLEETLEVLASAGLRTAGADSTSSTHGVQSRSPPVAVGSCSGRWGRRPAVSRQLGGRTPRRGRRLPQRALRDRCRGPLRAGAPGAEARGHRDRLRPLGIELGILRTA